MLKKIGYETILTDDYDLISNSKVLIFPGVGNFDHVMNKIYEKKIDKAILNSLEKNSKLLGICVGMQALFTKSEEGKIKGLDLIKGEIKKLNLEKKNIKSLTWVGIK
jgi:glutamine amidotransferase